jgi:hypothetical protein
VASAATVMRILVPGEGFEPPTFGLQNRCTATVLTRPASLNYNGYLNARSSATAVTSEIATQRLISARHTPT